MPRLIDADEAQKYADENMTEFSAGMVRFALSVAKTVEAEPVRHGRWIDRGKWVDCSECGTVGSPQWKRCPVCEAKMETLD